MPSSGHTPLDQARTFCIPTVDSMSNETVKAKARLAALSNSLTELETHLDPLLSQTLPETLLPLEPIQQAKLQTLLSYVTYDLIFSTL